MRAVRLDAFGGPDKLVLGDLPDPVAGPGQAVVRVKACALNHLDLWVLSGLPAYKIELPHVLGNDICGEIHALGSGVSSFKIGQRVVVSPGVSCWNCPKCLDGRDHLCESYKILGADGGRGGLAELALVPAKNLFPAPANLSDEEAAAGLLAGLTAYHMLKGLANLRKNQTLLVIGAGSGVGSAAVQIGKLLGAKVIAASRDEEKLKTAKTLGADEVLLDPMKKLAARARQLAGPKGVDVVFEHVGGSIFEDCIKALAPGGALVTCGATAQPEVKVDLRHVFFKELRILGAKMGPQSELKELLDHAAAGRFKPAVDKVFPLAEARKAFEHLAAGKQFGKVVLRP